MPLQVLFLTLFALINQYQHAVIILTEMHTALHTSFVFILFKLKFQ